MIAIIYNLPFFAVWDEVKYIYSPDDIDRTGHTVHFTTNAFGLFDEKVLLVPEEDVIRNCCGYNFRQVVYWKGEEHFKEETIAYMQTRLRWPKEENNG